VEKIKEEDRKLAQENESYLYFFADLADSLTVSKISFTIILPWH
jgi:hypothetical protein